MQLNRNDEHPIPFLDKLNLDKEKVIEAFLTPVNLAGTAAYVYSSLSSTSNNATEKSYLAEMASLYQSVSQAKKETTNKHGLIYNHAHQESLLEYKAIKSLIDDMTKSDAEAFIEKHKIRSINGENGVIFQNNDYNIAQMASVIADKKFEGISVLPRHSANDYANDTQNYLTPSKVQNKFLIAILDSVEPSTLESFKDLISIKQKEMMRASNKQRQEVRKDVEFLREKGHSVLDQDVRSFVESERLYNISRRHFNIKMIAVIAINRQEAIKLTKAIDNPELTDYVKDIRLLEYKDDQVCAYIKSLYKKNDDSLDYFMSAHTERQAPYQLASIIKKDKRRNDPDLQESILDESFFEPKRQKRFGFGR